MPFADLGLTKPKSCAICALPITFVTAMMDHSHKTGKVRGWLCRACNVGLGMFRDNPDTLRKAARYLIRNR